MVESPFSHERILTLKEQGIYQWIDSQIQNCGDRITGWRKEIQGATRETKGEMYLHFSTQGGYNLCLIGAESHAILFQDRQTRERIKEENKGKGVLYLSPDASSPYKVPLDLDPQYPEGMSFSLVGQFVLKENGREAAEGKKLQTVSVVDVLRDGWYKRAIFSPSSTSTAAQPDKFEKYQKVPEEEKPETRIFRDVIDKDGGLFFYTLLLEKFDLLFEQAITDEPLNERISPYYLNIQFLLNARRLSHSNVISKFLAREEQCVQDKTDLEILKKMEKMYHHFLMEKLTGVELSDPPSSEQLRKFVRSEAIQKAIRGKIDEGRLIKEMKEKINLGISISVGFLNRTIMVCGADNFDLSKAELSAFNLYKENFYQTLFVYHTFRLGVMIRLIFNEMLSFGLMTQKVDEATEELRKPLPLAEDKVYYSKRAKEKEEEAIGQPDKFDSDTYVLFRGLAEAEEGNWYRKSDFPLFSKMMFQAVEIYQKSLARIIDQKFNFVGIPWTPPEGFVVEKDPRIFSSLSFQT